MMDLTSFAKRRFFRRFNRAVRVGWELADSGKRSSNASRVGIGVALIGYGLIRGRTTRKLIYSTSIDVGEGATIRVMRGRRPLAETAPIR